MSDLMPWSKVSPSSDDSAGFTNRADRWHTRKLQMMGLESAAQGVARILGPIAFGAVYAATGAAVAFMGAATMVLLAMVITLVRQQQTLRDREQYQEDWPLLTFRL